MENILMEILNQTPAEKRRVEMVERKGVGHPDTICDEIMEQVSLALCREYRSAFGRILHHNTDKALLVAGRTDPRPGGGRVREPMRLVFGDRATVEYRGRRIDAGAVAENAARDWITGHLRMIDPDRHMVFQNELKQGSAELTDIFERREIGANDTSAGVGYAPLTETEQLVLEAERLINSPDFQKRFPEAGEDVKIMGCRIDRTLSLTVALAFIDRHVENSRSYFSRKREIRQALVEHLEGGLETIDRIEASINTLDDPERGEGGMYLTVLGTSAESGDCGQVGRGNRSTGIIPLSRPMSAEAVAGKNPISHVGKIYNLLAHRAAGAIHHRVPAVQEAYVWLCSQIGRPISRPLVASVQLVLEPGAAAADVQEPVDAVMEETLGGVGEFTERLARGEFDAA